MPLGRSLRSRFELDAPLGRGGLGELYQVRALGSGEPLALRITDLRDAPVVIDALSAVIELHHRLSAIPIARMRACGGDDGRAWYVTDFVPGESLLNRVRRAGRAPVHDAIQLAVKAAEVVATLHDQSVIHQDLSPRNLFVNGQDVVVLELGIAPALARLIREKPGLLTTPRARAAEQLVAKEADARTDIYALGALLYYLVTGRRAIADGPNILQLASTGGVRPPALGPVPEVLRPVLERALAMRPDDRFPTAREFVAVLETTRTAP